MTPCFLKKIVGDRRAVNVDEKEASEMRSTISVNFAIGTVQFAMTLLNTFFMFYYVKIYLNIFKINEVWFSIAQMMFIVWNAINDPLFGYAQDVSTTWFHNRRKVISFLGPLVSISFLVLWVSWGDANAPPYVTGLHLLCGLFLYDAFYSCVNVAWSALFAESTSSPAERISAVKYSQIAVLLSVNVVPITEKISNGTQNYFAFQIVAAAVTIIAALCFQITLFLKYYAHSKKDTQQQVLSSEPTKDHFRQQIVFAYRSTKEVLSQSEFRVVAVTYFLHTCRSTAHLNFAAIATELLIPEEFIPKGSWKMSAFYAACTLVPQIIFILGGTVVYKYGANRIIQRSFVVTIVISFGVFLFGFDKAVIIVAFMLFDSIAVHSIAPLYQILLAEYIDDDTAVFARAEPISSTVYSLASLLNRPAQSVAPMIVVLILNQYGYKDYQKDQKTSEQLVYCMFAVLTLAPLVLSALQYVVFQCYKRKSTKSNSMRTL